MIRNEELWTLKAVALCHKPYLKPEEAMIYCNLQRTQLAKRCELFGLHKNQSGYYKREHIDQMMSGEYSYVDIRIDAPLK